MAIWKLPASDLTFGWDDCQRCFYLKHVHGCRRPQSPMPKVFTTIDGLMKQFYNGKRTQDVLPFLPPGVVRFGDKWLQSAPLSIGGSKVVLTGRFDCVVAFDDGTFAVIDYKTSAVKDAHVGFYSRQLHAYATSLEQPAPGKFGLGPITKLGLVVVEHKKLIHGPMSFEIDLSWIECPRDDLEFNHFLGNVVRVLDASDPPEPNPLCGYCSYRDIARQLTA